MKPDKLSTARHIRNLDLLKVSMSDLAGWCQLFGRSGRGTREELMERVYNTVWQNQYDLPREYDSDYLVSVWLSTTQKWDKYLRVKTHKQALAVISSLCTRYASLSMIQLKIEQVQPND